MKSYQFYNKLLLQFLFTLVLVFFSCSKKQNEIVTDQKPLNRVLLDSAYNVIYSKDTTVFRRLNDKGLKLSIHQKDTFAIADAYWNLGAFHDNFEQWNNSYLYYNLAQKNFKAIKHYKNAGRMLYNMAVIQKDVKDFTGSEITAFRAIALFNEKEHQKYLYYCYNLLGVIHYNLNETEKSIEAHKTALNFLEQVEKKGTLLQSSYNNIGLTYQKAKDYQKAIEYFNMVLSNDSLKSLNPSLYAKALDNRTYNKLLSGDTLGIKKEFDKAYTIRDSIKYKSGLIISKLHISEYLALKKDTLNALKLTKEALTLAREVNNFNEKLLALKLLAKLDRTNRSNFLEKYIRLDDSLRNEEKKIRNKFTRISYETDKFIEEVDKQKKEKTLIYIISTISLLLFGASFYIKIQASRNKRLSLESEQQRDREQIYQLMLKQEHVHQEAKKEERARISEDLHEGVLGGLYGIRMNLGFLDFTKESKSEFDNYLNEIYNIEKEIRTISHALKSEILNPKTLYIPTLQKYIENINTNNNIKLSFKDDTNLNWEQINDDIKVNCFRIVQEAYYNTVKHAKAKSFIVSFYTEGEYIILLVKDNGIGFNPKTRNKGIGLKNIYSRVERLRGQISITSKPNQGIQIKVSIKKQYNTK